MSTFRFILKSLRIVVTCKSFKLEFQMLENQIEFQILENQIEYLADESSYLVHIILLKTSMT